MGKRKDHGHGSNEEESITESPSSSHKKHKKRKKKHKKHRDSMPEELEFSSPTSLGSLTPKPSIKLKLKLGGETVGTTSFTSSITSSIDHSIMPTGLTVSILPPDDPYIDVLEEPWSGPPRDDLMKTKKPGDETSDEEKAWLDALESGKLDDFEEKQKKKDPKLLTARQRALIHGNQEEELLQLPSGYKNVPLTEEQLQRRQQRAKKRRLQAHEKREKDKKQTLDRLLKKQECKLKGPKGRGNKRANFPRYHYTSINDSITISVPVGYNFPFQAQPPRQPPKAILCGVSGCKNQKKYSCSKTGVPLCSLDCYKKNMSLHSPGAHIVRPV